jgi:hypothetical protein
LTLKTHQILLPDNSLVDPRPKTNRDSINQATKIQLEFPNHYCTQQPSQAYKADLTLELLTVQELDSESIKLSLSGSPLVLSELRDFFLLYDYSGERKYLAPWRNHCRRFE